MELLDSHVLTVINSTSKFSEFATTEDQVYEIRAGLFPKEWLYEHLHAKYPRAEIARVVAGLVRRRKIIETESYFILNPKNRARPIVSAYDIPKPKIYVTMTRSFRLAPRDRYLLWAAAARHPRLEGECSKGERFGLVDILRFFRLKPVQRLWRKYKQLPNWRLPDEAL